MTYVIVIPGGIETGGGDARMPPGWLTLRQVDAGRRTHAGARSWNTFQSLAAIARKLMVSFCDDV